MTFEPPRNGEGDRAKHGGGVCPFGPNNPSTSLRLVPLPMLGR